ncbi:MAG: hypothetical protein H7268_00475 [Sandarakinorhabdus sp.]|nr:hypothetical protein [Sandarakinorhabdus sp.]
MTEATEAAKTRRRWLSFAEIATVVALVISAASFWDSHQERAETRADAARQKPVAAAPLVLTASAEAEGAGLRLAATGNDRVIQTQTIVFPTALDAAAVDTVGNPHIETDWFAGGLRSAVGADRKPGRLPVGIITHYTDKGTDRTDTAIYEIGHSWRSRLLQSDVPRLEGITLIARLGRNADAAALQKRLDARWSAHHPAA